MTLLLEEPTAADDQNAQLLFKEARRRRRRLRIIWMAMGATVIVVFVGLGLTLDRSSSPPSSSVGVTAHPGWPPHLRTGATLVYALNDLRILDADSGATRVLPLPAPYGGSRDLAMVTVGHSFLLNRGDTAWLYSGSTNRKPVDLGPSDGVFRGPNSNEAWVWTQPCAPILGCTNYNAPQMGSVHLVDGAGRQIGAAVALPGVDGWYPTGVAGKAGMVLQQQPPYGNHRNQLELWNPLTDRVVHVFANAYVLGTGGNSVVWETAAPYCRTNCSLHVLNALNGSERTVQLPPGVSGNWRRRDLAGWSHDRRHGCARLRISHSRPPSGPLDRSPYSSSEDADWLRTADLPQPWSDVPHMVNQRLVVFIHCWEDDSGGLASW